MGVQGDRAAGKVAMTMTWNVHVTPGNSSLAVIPHRLMGPKPRPVLSLSATDSNVLNVIWNAKEIGNAETFPKGKGATLACRSCSTILAWMSRK